MLRKLAIALAASLAIGAGFTATEASAAGHSGHGGFSGHAGFHGGFHGGFRGFGTGIGFYGYPAYGYGDGCYQVRRVPTPYGWRLRRVWVCG